MLQKSDKSYFVIFILLGVAAILCVFLYWYNTLNIQENSVLSLIANPKKTLEVRLGVRKEKAEQREVKGIYLTAYSAGSPPMVDWIIELINKTELNAVVIDIKDYTGKILYDSNIALVNQLKTERNMLGDIKGTIWKLHNNGIYVIARQTVFQDPILASKQSNLAIWNTSGSVWKDNNGLSWVDPSKQAVWDYNIQIAREAIHLGFDEINFDYVRFPSDGDMKAVALNFSNEQKNEVMGNFFSYLGNKLKSEPAWISVDMFGFVMERHNGMSIGQRLEDVVDSVDYVCPMMYPSHYPSGHLGLGNPAEHPGLVVETGMEKGMPYFVDKRAQARPWIQAFNLGATYDAEKIRAQIDAVEKYSDGGWLLWNAANRYSEAGLNPA